MLVARFKVRELRQSGDVGYALQVVDLVNFPGDANGVVTVFDLGTLVVEGGAGADFSVLSFGLGLRL